MNTININQEAAKAEFYKDRLRKTAEIKNKLKAGIRDNKIHSAKRRIC